MIRPPEGYYRRVEWIRNRDGDTMLFRLPTGQEIAIRLVECWAPELDTLAGQAAKEYLDRMCVANEAEHGGFYIGILPFADKNHDGRLDITDILKGLTFDRVPGRAWVGEFDVSTTMVAMGHATRDR